LGNYVLYNITIVKVKDNLQKIWKISKKPIITASPWLIKTCAGKKFLQTFPVAFNF